MESNLSVSRKWMVHWPLTSPAASPVSVGDEREAAATHGSATATCAAPNYNRTCTAVAAGLTAMMVANLLTFSQAFTPSWRALPLERGWGAKKARESTTVQQRSFAARRRGSSWLASSAVQVPLPARRTCRRRSRNPSSSQQPPSIRSDTVTLMALGLSSSSISSSSCSSTSPSAVQQCTSTLDAYDGALDLGERRLGDRNRNRHRPIRPDPTARIVTLEPGEPIEFWHDKGLVLGNYEGSVRGRNSLLVRTESGEPLTIDAGQVVGIWSKNEMWGEQLPGDAAAWGRIRGDATALLQSVPGRGLDLEPFWKAAVAKGKGFVTTPAHAAEFLFGGDPAAGGVKGRGGLKKRPAFQFPSPGEAYSPTGVERAAAVQVLAVELNRFKRMVSQRLDQQPPSDGSSKITGAADGETVVLQLGGFKALDQSVAATREVADFCRVVESIKALNSAEAVAQRERKGGRARGRQGGGDRGKEPFTIKEGLFEPPFMLILHSLEAFAIGGDERSLTSEAKRVMELMGKSNPAAAKQILVDVGLWTLKTAFPYEEEKDGRLDALEDEIEVEVGAEGGGEATTRGVIPWPKEALEAAAALTAERARRARKYDGKASMGEVGAPASFGRHDFRNASFGVYCIDGKGTSFLDDAFSIDPETREVFVHITDVQGLVAPGSTLDEVARLRAASEYLPQGPLFMMPPTALKAMSFSDRTVNEAITVGIRLDPETGAVSSSRAMLTVLPPVLPLTFVQAERLLEAEKGEEITGRLARVAAEIRAIEYVSRRSAQAGGRQERGREGVRLRVGSGGKVRATEVPQSRALGLVDELLTVYTLEVYGLCRKASVAMPTLVGQQDRVAAGRSRYGTGPLRRYVDILAQRQIAAILTGAGYLAKDNLLETASYLTWRHNKTRSRRQQEAGRLSLESLAAHCLAQVKATGLPHAVMPARGTGRGREVRLEGLGVCVHVKRAPGSGRRGVAIERGQEVRVVIRKVDPGLKQVVAIECLDDRSE